jgi:hypothetical protein
MMVFQQRGETIAGRNCFVDEGGEEDDGKGMKNTEQWCFSIGEMDGKLLAIGVSATGKVVANGVAAEEGEEKKSETSAGRSCFGSENDGGMGCFCD